MKESLLDWHAPIRNGCGLKWTQFCTVTYTQLRQQGCMRHSILTRAKVKELATHAVLQHTDFSWASSFPEHGSYVSPTTTIHTHTLIHREHLQPLKVPSHLSCLQTQVLYVMTREDMKGPDVVCGEGVTTVKQGMKNCERCCFVNGLGAVLENI